MWVELTPTKLWGRPIQTPNYNRLAIDLDKGIDDGIANKPKSTPELASKRVKYGNGLFYIFKTASKTIKLKYKLHHSNKDDYMSSRQALVEPMLCGKVKGTNTWIMLNTCHMIDSTYPIVAEKEWVVTYTFKEDFEEFQLCLPFGAIMYYIFVETDKELKLVTPTPLKFGFLGSSVTNMSALYAASSLTAQLYRKLGINSCNLAIPMTNSIVYNKILDIIKIHKEAKWYVLDTMHLCEKNIENAKKLGIKFACIKTRSAKYIFKENYIFELNDPCFNRDHVHLTTAGAVAFVEKLIPLLKEDM